MVGGEQPRHADPLGEDGEGEDMAEAVLTKAVPPWLQLDYVELAHEDQ